MHWLPPATINRLGQLEFNARGLVDGFIAGRHRSARKGASVEFAEHRQYSPGDDLRKLDWKLAARRQRLYVREYTDETNLRATLVLDASGSMGYRGRRAEDRLSKFDYGRYLSAALAYLLVKQQDAVGFAGFAAKLGQLLPAKAQKTQVKSLLEMLDSLEPGGESALPEALDELAERIPRRSVVFVLSDFYAPLTPLVKALHHLRFRHHEVVALQIVADEELSFPFERMSLFHDLESSARLEVDVKAVKKDYLERYSRHLADLKRACGEMHIVHELLNTSVPYVDALSDVLVNYARKGGGR